MPNHKGFLAVTEKEAFKLHKMSMFDKPLAPSMLKLSI